MYISKKHVQYCLHPLQKDSIVSDVGDRDKEPTSTNGSLSDVVTSDSFGKQAQVPVEFLNNNRNAIKTVNIRFNFKQNVQIFQFNYHHQSSFFQNLTNVKTSSVKNIYTGLFP